MRLVLIILAISYASARSILNDEDDYDKRMHPDLSSAEERIFIPKNPREQTSQYWIDNARQQTLHQLKKKFNINVAKNVIMFIGDGMSIPTLAATRVYMGGEEERLAFEKFDFTGMSMTYCVNKQVADSACSATAYLTGVKGNYGTIGVNAKAPRYNCTAALLAETHTYSIAKWAMDAGKDAGLVTTTRVTHASPAGVYAHIGDRDWENNEEVLKRKCNDALVDDIAEQLVHGPIGERLKVVLGGGRREFLDKSILDPETKAAGYRSDKKNLIDEWLKKDEENRTYVWKKSDLLKVNPAQTDRLLGLFDPSHCQYNLNVIHKELEEEPSLLQMFDKASDILMKNEKGFFLFVEGGRIDHGHHDTQARFALDETAEFSKAIEFARKKFSDDDTLIVVTSDHGHTMTYGGYANRRNDIFGTAGSSKLDNLPYMTLSYANGPGHYVHLDKNGGRKDIRKMDTEKDNFKFPATVPLDSETHGGEDVGVFASGPFSHLFSGTFEQNTIPHMMAYAACIGDGLKACD